jgi:protein-L-isoaspartate(D-aspartate) O-methyltransferase
MDNSLDTMRQNMIKGQFEPIGISDSKLIEAFLSVPRELFFPKEDKSISYFDGHIEIKKNRWLLSSQSIARLINLVKISPDDIILEIGSSTGYASAILAHLASLVITIEQDAELIKHIEENLSKISYDNTVIVREDHTLGYEKSAPYDKIFIFGSVSKVSDNILSQLAENGSLITVLNNDNLSSTFGKAVVIKKNKDIMNISDYYEIALPLVPGFKAKEEFKF